MAELLATAENRQRLVKLFEFLKAYTDMRFPPVRDIAKQPKFLWLNTLPAHPEVEVFVDFGDRKMVLKPPILCFDDAAHSDCVSSTAARQNPSLIV